MAKRIKTNAACFGVVDVVDVVGVIGVVDVIDVMDGCGSFSGTTQTSQIWPKSCDKS